MFDLFFSLIPQLTVGSILLCAVAIALRHRSLSMDLVLVPASAAAALPTSIALIFVAFDTSYLPKLADLYVHLALAGLAVLLMSVFSIVSSFRALEVTEKDAISQEDLDDAASQVDLDTTSQAGQKAAASLKGSERKTD